MKLFENKIGRPSNDILMKRRTFYLVVAALVVSLVGVATYAITNLESSKLKGSIFDSLKSKGTVKVQKPSNTSFPQPGDRVAKYRIANNTNKSVFYRWFTYSSTSTLTKYLGYVQDGCGEVQKGKTYTMSPTLQVSSKSPNRAGKLKVYKTKEACLKDNKGSSLESLYGSYVVKYKYTGTDDVTTTVTKAPNKTTTKAPVETGNACGDKVIYNATKYSLTESQIIKLAKMVYAEYSADIAGMKAVASHMANLYESRYSSRSAQGLYNYITTTGWYAARTKSNNNYNQNAVNAVKQCIVNGQRTLPTYIDEFDMFPGDIKNPLSKSSYVRGQTKVNNKYGSSGTFWCFSSSSYGTNIFFYTKK